MSPGQTGHKEEFVQWLVHRAARTGDESANRQIRQRRIHDMDYLPQIGALIALTQACIAIAVFWSSRRQRFVDLGTQRVIRIQDWGNDCIGVLSEAGQFCLLNTSDASRAFDYEMYKGNILHRLSALIDQGRLFYRNSDRHEYGQHKFPARRGYRPEILDPLVAAYRSVQESGGSADPDGFERLYEWRGRFISLLQYEVDPTWLRNARFYPDGPRQRGRDRGGGRDRTSKVADRPFVGVGRNKDFPRYLRCDHPRSRQAAQAFRRSASNAPTTGARRA